MVSVPMSGAPPSRERNVVDALLKAMDLLLVCVAAAVMGISF